MASLRQAFERWQKSMHYQYNALEPQFQLLELMVEHLLGIEKDKKNSNRLPPFSSLEFCKKNRNIESISIPEFCKKYPFLSKATLQEIAYKNKEFKNKCVIHLAYGPGDSYKISELSALKYFQNSKNHPTLSKRLNTMIEDGIICLPSIN